MSDGKNSVTIQASGDVLNLTGWNLTSVTLTLSSQVAANNGCNTFNLQIVATSVDPANGSMAGVAKNITVQLLNSQACATPVGVNPYVVYVNNVSSTQILQPQANQIVFASQLVPVSSSYASTDPLLQWTSFTNQTTDPDGDEVALNPVMDLNANPEDFIFTDASGVTYDAGSGWLSGFLGVSSTTTQDAASLTNLSVTLTKNS